LFYDRDEHLGQSAVDRREIPAAAGPRLERLRLAMEAQESVDRCSADPEQACRFLVRAALGACPQHGLSKLRRSAHIQ